MKDRELVTAFLAGRDIHAVVSSPYRRAVLTVEGFAGKTILLPQIHMTTTAMPVIAGAGLNFVQTGVEITFQREV